MALRTAGTAPRRFPSITRRWWKHPDNVVIALTLVFTVAIATRLQLPAQTPPLRIVNNSALTVSLDVRPTKVSGWTGLGIASPGQTTVDGAIDQGRLWVVRAQVGSHTATSFVVSRAQLEDQRWKLTIPSAVTDQLRADGAVPER